MNFNNFTIRSQEVVQKAIELTRQSGRQQIEPVHLLKAIFSESETIVNFVFQKIGTSLPPVTAAVDKEIEALPKVSGGDVFLSRESNESLQKAVDYSKSKGDEYVSVEAMLMGIMRTKCPASRILKDFGMTEKSLDATIAEGQQGYRAECIGVLSGFIEIRHKPE